MHYRLIYRSVFFMKEGNSACRSTSLAIDHIIKTFIVFVEVHEDNLDIFVFEHRSTGQSV